MLMKYINFNAHIGRKWTIIAKTISPQFILNISITEDYRETI